MTKRKRPRYGNPARQAELKTGSHRRPDSPVGVPTGHGFNQLARRTCGDCGAPVEWMTAQAAEGRGIDLSGAQEFLGVDSIDGESVWACVTCDNFGVMGPTETL